MNFEDPIPFVSADSVALFESGSLYVLEYQDAPTSTVHVLDVSSIYDDNVGPYDARVKTVDAFDVTSDTVGIEELTINDEEYLLTYTASEFSIFDTRGSAERISTTVIDTSFCPQARFTRYTALGPFLYASAFVKSPRSSSCPGLMYEDEDYGTYPIFVFDLRNPSTPVLVSRFTIEEVQDNDYADFSFGAGAYAQYAAVSMSSSGLVFYDFTDEWSPGRVSDNVLEVETMERVSAYGPDGDEMPYSFVSAVYKDAANWLASVDPDDTYATIFEVSLTSLDHF